MSDILPIPCPFCGCTTITVSEGSTFRWAIAKCDNCGATSGEVRINTMKARNESEIRTEVIEEWNKRTAIGTNIDKDACIAELERRLAEQQAILTEAHQCFDAAVVEGLFQQIEAIPYEAGNLRGLVERRIMFATSVIAEYFDSTFRDKELNNLLAKAKEEGRKEAVPEGWRVAPKEPTPEMIGSAWTTSNFDSDNQLRASYKAMLSAAPKP